ncbi:MAG: hypothetical protein ACXWC9_04800 [Pseudobdellovibrionaceae bacterium]
MFSKIAQHSFFVLAFVASTGCNLPLNETPPEPKPIEVSLGEATGCLSRVMPVVQVYFEGKAQSAQVDATWNCISTALETFEKSVNGRYEDRFTSREVAHFIEQYFLEDGERLPDSLMVEIFRIKQLFVGGAIDSISRVEMKNMSPVIRDLKRITLQLNSYMNVFTLNWDSSYMRDLNSNHFEDATFAIQHAAKDLGGIIEKNGLPYRMEYVTNLLREFETFSQSGWAWISEVEKAIPLVKKIKKALAGGSEDEIAPTEWRRFALLGARGYVQYLRYHYFIKSKTLSSGSNQVSYFTKSIGDLFSYLGDMVDSKPGQMLTRSELVEMLNAIALLIPKLKVSDELVLELMKIKVVFFGGRVDFFVKADFDRAQGKLMAFQDLTERFLKYSDVYGFSWKPESLSISQAQKYFRQAEANLDEFSWRLGALMEDAYDLQNIVALTEEIERLYPSTDPDEDTLVETSEKFVPTIVAIKNILFSDHNSVVGSAHSTMTPMAQWSDFLGLIAKSYSRYMFYSYFLEKKTWTEGHALEGMNQLVLKSVDIIDGMIDKKQTGAISYLELGQLWAAVLKTKVLPEKITQAILDSLTRTLMQKFLLSPEDRLSGNIPNGLTKVAIKTIKNEFTMWVENQKFLDIAYSGVPVGEGKSGAAILVDLGASAPTTGLQELQMIYSSPVPMSFDAMGRLYLSQPAKNYLRKTSDTINVVREAVRLVIRSYAGDLARIQNYQGLTQAEVQTLYADLKPVVVALGFLHPNNMDFADNRFRDANLFMSVSDGNDLGDFKELSDLFMMILSGLKLDSMMFEKMEQAYAADPAQGCKVTKPTEYKDDWLVDLQCVLGFYAKEMPGVFVSMPDYLTYQATLDKPRFEGMFMNLLKSAGHKSWKPSPVPGQPAEIVTEVHIGDLSLVPHVMQYVEGFFQMYDADRNGLIVTSESMKAYPVFRTILQQVSGLKKENELKGLFTWMLKYGKPPQSGAEKIKFATWWVPQGESGWKIEADRERLASILGFIAEALEKP